MEQESGGMKPYLWRCLSLGADIYNGNITESTSHY